MILTREYIERANVAYAPDLMRVRVEYTDTFGGEANYSWVQREDMLLPESATDAYIKRKAKKVMGLTGVRGKWESWADTLAFKPRGSCTIMFIYYDYQ